MKRRKKANQEQRNDSQSEIKKNHYVTNDTLQIHADFTKDIREMQIHEGPRKRLAPREYIVLRILTQLLLATARPAAAEPDAWRTFLPVKAILSEILALRHQGMLLQAQWPGLGETDIHRVVYRLRKKIRAQKGNPNLVEKGDYATGYRLSTPRQNVQLFIIGRDLYPDLNSGLITS